MTEETEEKKQENVGQDGGNAGGSQNDTAAVEKTESPAVEEELPSVDSILSSSRKEEEEESVQDICNRYLNIFRQLHVLSESSVARYNEEVKDAPEDVVFDLYNLPGGLELIDHITFLRTGEKVNSRRLRARQKQEEEMGFAPKKKKEKEPEPQPAPVQQQPIIQYIPMPAPAAGGEGSADGAEAMASMQAMMAQFVSMQQNTHAAPSFSASELATALLNGQKELMAQQTKNYLEGQKALLAAQTKAFVDGQKTLVEMQREISKSAEETILSAQDKLMAEAREAIDKQQKILFAMQKSMLDEMSSRINEIVGKVAENAKPTVDYGILSDMQEKFSTAQSEAIAAIGKENVSAMEKVAESIKNLQIVNNITQTATPSYPTNTMAFSAPADDDKTAKPAKDAGRKIETIQAQSQAKEGDAAYLSDEEFVRIGREKRRERFKKHHQADIGGENTFAVSNNKSLPKDSVFVDASANAEPAMDDKDSAGEEVGSPSFSVAETVNENNVPATDNTPTVAISDVVGDGSGLADNDNNAAQQQNDEEDTVVISDDVGGAQDNISSGSSPNVIQPVTGQNEPPLSNDEENVSSSPAPAESIYNRPKVEDIRPDSEPFIPVQGSLKNLPAPGVMSEMQENRTEKNIGFAINQGTYKENKSGGAGSSGLDDPFSKKISPKSISRFKSKKSSGSHEKEDKKGIFSVFKKLVKDEEASGTDV